MPHFDNQSARRISRSVLFTERMNRARTPHVPSHRNVSQNPFYWAVANADILRGQSGIVQLLATNDSPISGETRTAANRYGTTVWQNSKCLCTIVDGEFRIVAADAATFLVCSATTTVSAMDASFSATVSAELDGFFGKGSITVQNTFAQSYTSSEKFMAFRDEANNQWVADKIGGGGGGSNESIVRFELTATLTLAGTTAAAETLDQAGVKTGTVITVHDRVGEWAGVSGYQGIAFRGDNVASHYDIIFLEAKARWIRAELNADLYGGSASANVTSYFGAAPNGRNPGSTVTVFDATGDFFFARDKERILAVLNEKLDRYEVVWVEFPADVFAVALTQDGGVAGVNGTTSCSYTYTVRNDSTSDLLGSTKSPLSPRPSLTQMVAATRGIAHWDLIGGVRTLILDHAFENPTPRTTGTFVSRVVCNPTTGIDVYQKQIYFPVGTRIDTEALAGTLLCVGGGSFGAGCGIVETTPGSGVYQVDTTALAGDGIAVDPSTSCGLKVDHDSCTLEMIGTSPNKQLQVKLKANGGLDCSSGIRIDPASVTSDVIKSVSGCILEIDEVNNTLKLTIEYQPYTIQKNSAGVPVSGSFGAATTLSPCTVGVEECP